LTDATPSADFARSKVFLEIPALSASVFISVAGTTPLVSLPEISCFAVSNALGGFSCPFCQQLVKRNLALAEPANAARFIDAECQ
jgi:hypothetical protein